LNPQRTCSFVWYASCDRLLLIASVSNIIVLQSAPVIPNIPLTSSLIRGNCIQEADLCDFLMILPFHIQIVNDSTTRMNTSLVDPGYSTNGCICSSIIWGLIHKFCQYIRLTATDGLLELCSQAKLVDKFSQRENTKSEWHQQFS